MTDFVIDGKPFEAPEGAAAERYAMTPPSVGEAFGAMFGQGSLLDPGGTHSLTRAAEIGEFYPETPAGQDFTLPPRQASPTLSPEEYNAKYAPMGPDGKPVPIGDKPMPEGAARLIGKAKAAEIEREGVLNRFSAAHSFPVTFALGTAAFLMDPLNLATAFIPGVGEEAIAARLGAGFAARVAGRASAGATAGAAGFAPLSALRFGLGQQEASDYGLRDAFRDMLYGAAGGAIFHSGIGTAAEIIRGRPSIVPRETVAPEVSRPSEPIPTSAPNIDPATNASAIHGAIGQLTEGRPVDVSSILPDGALPIRSELTFETLGRDIQSLAVKPTTEAVAAHYGVSDEDAAHMLNALSRRPDTPIEIARGKYAKEGEELLWRMKNPDRVDAQMREMDRYAWREFGFSRSDFPSDAAFVNAAIHAHEEGTYLQSVAAAAEKVKALYREGFAPGLAPEELRAVNEAAYAPKLAETEGKPGAQVKPPAEPKTEGGPEPIKTPLTDELRAHEQMSQGQILHPEDAAEIAGADAEIAKANTDAQAYLEAAACLAGAGL